jgi:LmbE family N-acetylglucosaminyl deacetylase
MRALTFPPAPLTVLGVAAHPDDLEIGCGATLLALTASRAVDGHVVVCTGSRERLQEANRAAQTFWGDALPTVHAYGLPDGRLPAHWNELKDRFERTATRVQPDVVLAPRLDDAHQDHRLLAELVPTVWRDALVLHYEIPKWDGDLGSATHYVPVDAATAHRKVALLDDCYPSRRGRDWWDAELFLGLMRLRGMECRNRYAEAFVVRKAVVTIG